jgi:hypothetical protein
MAPAATLEIIPSSYPHLFLLSNLINVSSSQKWEITERERERIVTVRSEKSHLAPGSWPTNTNELARELSRPYHRVCRRGRN